MSPSPVEARGYGIDLFLGGSKEGTVSLLPVQTISASELTTYSTSKYTYDFPEGTRAVHYFPQTSFKTQSEHGVENEWLMSHFSLVDRLCGFSRCHNGYGNHYPDAVCQKGETAKTNLFDLYGITFVPSTFERDGFLAMGEGDAYHEFQPEDSSEEKIEDLLN